MLLTLIDSFVRRFAFLDNNLSRIALSIYKTTKCVLFCEKKMVKFDNSRNVINRILIAYKLKTVKSLADKWNMTASVIGSRVQRNTFPADYIIRCMLDTGADLLWLCTGEGESNVEGVESAIKKIEVSTEALEKLERIAALKKDGAITEDEYQLLKSSIFNN